MIRMMTLAGLTCISFIVRAQTVVIHETVSDSVVDSRGSNTEGDQLGVLYDFTFYGGGDQPGIDGILARSLGVNFLFNHKIRLTGRLLLPIYFGYSNESYGFHKSGSNKSFPDTFDRQNARFIFNGFAAGTGLKMLLYRSLYVEGGLLVKWHPWRNYEFQVSDGKNTFDVTLRNPDYTNSFKYDAYARFGLNGVNLCAYYRLSDMFSPSRKEAYTAEMPRIRLGVSFGF